MLTFVGPRRLGVSCGPGGIPGDSQDCVCMCVLFSEEDEEDNEEGREVVDDSFLLLCV